MIALFPVFASFFFGSHTEHWTDLILLALVAVYLHNCVAVPNGYYKVSRRRYKTSNEGQLTAKQREVSRQLWYAELQAFGGLIFAPICGAALLHYVRGTMARPANGLITNFNITVFILAAEIRPLKIAYTYLTARSEQLQEELIDVAPSRYDELANKMSTLESELRYLKGEASKNDNMAHANGSTDHADLEQIKQALRRFERHEMQLKQHYEEKLYSLERQLADLAHKSPIVQENHHASPLHLIFLPVKVCWALFTLPLRMLQSTAPTFKNR